MVGAAYPCDAHRIFLSIQAQDFIEEFTWGCLHMSIIRFLSIQAQDFIED